MDQYVYLLYILVLKHGMTPSEIYDACKNRRGAIGVSYLGPYGSTKHPYPDAQERMRIWICRTLVNREINIYSTDVVSGDPKYLADFIAIHATDAINLTWWDKIFTSINRWFK